MLTAITRQVSPALESCDLLHLPRQPIDFTTAERQHTLYRSCLERLGATVVTLPAEPALPDSVFVEDPAVVLDEVAIITRPASPLRRQEGETLARALGPFRPIRWLEEPALLEGGDVLRIGQRLFVGLSSRTNRAGIEQLAAIAGPLGYTVEPVEVRGCLHLKTACCHIGGETLLVNSGWIDVAPLAEFERIDVPAEEPFGANVLRIADTVIVPAAVPRTQELLRALGLTLHTLDISELAKAEAGLTCMSLLFESEPAA